MSLPPRASVYSSGKWGQEPQAWATGGLSKTPAHPAPCLLHDGLSPSPEGVDVAPPPWGVPGGGRNVTHSCTSVLLSCGCLPCLWGRGCEIAPQRSEVLLRVPASFFKI